MAETTLKSVSVFALASFRRMSRPRGEGMSKTFVVKRSYQIEPL